MDFFDSRREGPSATISPVQSQESIPPSPTPMDAAAPGLPAWRRVDPLQGILFLAIAAAVWVLFDARGSDSNTAVDSRSIFRWLTTQWKHENFKNNWVMLLVSAYAAYRQRDTLARARKAPSPFGMGVVLASLALHVIGYRTQQPRISLMSLVGVGWGACYALWGWTVAKTLLFPAGYALLCFSSSLLMGVTMPLRLMASQLAEVLLHGIGIEAVRKGTVIFSNAGGGFQFDVADACSGLRSLIVMTALAAPYAHFTLKGLWRQWALFLLAVPLAMLANTLRIFTLAIVAEGVGMKLAMSIYHDFSGYLVFILAIALLMATASLLEIDWRTRWRGWKERVFSRT